MSSRLQDSKLDSFSSKTKHVHRRSSVIRRRRLTFASSERGDLSGSGSDVIDDGILKPGHPEDRHRITSVSLLICFFCIRKSFLLN